MGRRDTNGAAPETDGPSLQRALLACGVSAAMLLGGCGGSDSADQSQVATAAPAAEMPTTPATPEPMPKVVLSLRRPPRNISGDDVLVAGTVTRGASITVRGRRAVVRRGRFRIRLKVRVGVNRFTVVARRDGHRTARRLLRVRREPPPPPPQLTPAPPARTPGGGGFSSSNCDGPSTASGECLPGSTELPQQYPEHNEDQIPDVPGNQGE